MSHLSVVPVSYFNLPLPLKGFKAYKIDRGLIARVSYHRRDLYKLYLISVKCNIYYQEEKIEIDGNVLFFAGPHATYSWENISEQQSGYSCLFTEDFLNRHPLLAHFIHSPLLGLGNLAFVCLNQKQQERITSIFHLLLSAQDTTYLFKHELIAGYLHCLIHEILKMQPSENG